MAAAETVQADPTGIAYDDAGQGDPSLLFMHGWCGDRSFFAPQASHFSTAHRVLNVDLPAHGQSSAPAAFTIEGLATEVTALARSMRLSRIVAVGHSIGAMVALELTAQAPELVSAVVMVDPPPLSKEVWQGFAGQLIPSFQGPDGDSSSRCSCRPTTPTAGPRSSPPCARYRTTLLSRWSGRWRPTTR